MKTEKALTAMDDQPLPVLWHKEGGVGILTLNKPPSNGMTIALFERMTELAPEIINDKTLTGILIHGAGRHFSSGTDLEGLLGRIKTEGCGGDSRKDNASEGFLARNYRSVSFFESLPVPVVAAIRGVCLGSAFELALFSHFRFCSEDSVFGLPESTFNLMPGLGGLRRLTELAGKAKAIELVLKGKTFGAREALEMNLVDRILPKKELMPWSMEFIRKIAGKYHPEKRKLYLMANK
jgi:enoyl-CoA hydratase